MVFRFSETYPDSKRGKKGDVFVMNTDTQLKYNVVYRYVCTCGAIKAGILVVLAGTAAIAEAEAVKSSYTCCECGRADKRNKLSLVARLGVRAEVKPKHFELFGINRGPHALRS